MTTGPAVKVWTLPLTRPIYFSRRDSEIQRKLNKFFQFFLRHSQTAIDVAAGLAHLWKLIELVEFSSKQQFVWTVLRLPLIRGFDIDGKIWEQFTNSYFSPLCFGGTFQPDQLHAGDTQQKPKMKGTCGLNGNSFAWRLLEILQARPRPLVQNCRTIWTLSLVFFFVLLSSSYTAMYVHYNAWERKDWHIGHVSFFFSQRSWKCFSSSHQKTPTPNNANINTIAISGFEYSSRHILIVWIPFVCVGLFQPTIFGTAQKSHTRTKWDWRQKVLVLPNFLVFSSGFEIFFWIRYSGVSHWYWWVQQQLQIRTS